MVEIEQITDFSHKLFENAQKQFGNIGSNWIYHGVEINDNGPNIKYYPESGHVTISLSTKVLEDDEQLIFQLSHEIVHLLHPSQEYPSLFKNQTKVINEGLSTYYSISISNSFFNNKDRLIDSLKTFNANYYQAYLSVDKLLKMDSSAIKKLKSRQPIIDKLTEEDFKVLEIKIPKNLLRNLLAPF